MKQKERVSIGRDYNKAKQRYLEKLLVLSVYPQAVFLNKAV